MVITVEREVERIEKFFLFAHYDSRGGATGIVARNHLETLRAYADVFDPEGLRRYVAEREGAEAGERAYDNAIDAAADDFIHRYELRVADKPLPAKDAELLLEYEGAGYCFGVVQTRYWRVAYDDEGHVVEGKGIWSKWTDTDVAVVWKGKKPGVTVADTVLNEQARIDKRDVGEDAFGLVLQRVTGPRS